nr:hypothetical protein BaRGS_013257 [Batillaria attramentaria]
MPFGTMHHLEIITAPLGAGNLPAKEAAYTPLVDVEGLLFKVHPVIGALPEVEDLPEVKVLSEVKALPEVTVLPEDRVPPEVKAIQEDRVSKPDTSSMSLVEKLFRFMVYLRNETPRVNDIQTVENAITGCHLDLKTTYESEEVGNYQNRRIFSGRLLINDVFLARAVGQTKKELKHECYKLALEVLKTKDVGQILQQKDVGIEAIRQTFEECSKKPDAGKPDGAQAEAATAKLATAAPIAVAVETVATPEERWSEFITYVRGNASQAINAISRIEMALSGSRCGLDRAYSDCALQVTVKPMFQGSLMIGGILQAQAEGFKKKEAKQKTYELAVERFTTLELAEILKGVEPKEVEDVHTEEKPKNVVMKEIRTPEQIRRLEIFIDRIKDSSVKEGPITLMDMTANQLQLIITCIYRRMYSDGMHIYSCQMYIGDILISEGEGTVRKETQMDAYCKAYERLISTPLETIMSESHRLNPADVNDPEIEDVVVKGQVKQVESNLSRLRKQFMNLDEAISEKKSSEMVIVEHEDWVHDRKKHAFCILQNSALMNIMLLEWNIDAMTGFFNCKVSLQGEELGSARAGSKQVARNLSAADALFKMYETQPVLRIIATKDWHSWITLEQMMEKMKQMKESEFAEAIAMETETSTPGKITKRKVEHTEAEESAVIETEEKLRVVAQRMIEEYIERGDVLAELAFSPELPVSIRRTLPGWMAKRGLRAHQRQKDGKFYLAITFRTRVDKIVEAMKERGVTKTNKFLLIEDRSELPCHADIILDIEAARTAPRKLETAPLQYASFRPSKSVGGQSLNVSRKRIFQAFRVCPDNINSRARLKVFRPCQCNSEHSSCSGFDHVDTNITTAETGVQPCCALATH